MEDGLERLIAFTSRTLSKAEVSCAHLEKEALATSFGTQKFFDKHDELSVVDGYILWENWVTILKAGREKVRN